MNNNEQMNSNYQINVTYRPDGATAAEAYLVYRGLRFDFCRLVDMAESDSYDITTIVVWLPNCSTEPMLIVNWFFGSLPKDVSDVIRYIDGWLQNQPYSIEQLRQLQDIIEQ